MTETKIQNWMWMFPVAMLFLLAPILYIGVTWERMFIWFTSAVGAKWLLFAIMNWTMNTDTGNRIVGWTNSTFTDTTS